MRRWKLRGRIGGCIVRDDIVDGPRLPHGDEVTVIPEVELRTRLDKHIAYCEKMAKANKRIEENPSLSEKIRNRAWARREAYGDAAMHAAKWCDAP